MSKKNKKYWKSLNELDGKVSTEVVKDEFMNGVTDEFNISSMSGLSRRKFLGLLSIY